MVGPAARQPAAVLVVAAWREGAPPRLAARITYTTDVAGEERVRLTVAGAEAIAAVVRRWLDELDGVEEPVTQP